jgi:hypothetical protein
MGRERRYTVQHRVIAPAGKTVTESEFSEELWKGFM